MEKLTIVSNFTKSIDILRNTECGKKEKLSHFHHISECLLSPFMTGHVNYTKYCSNAISLLLFFCEDLDSAIRMSAEENLNRIIRSLETNRTSRIFLDLYYEIKKNGNEKSLRICLNLFSYYCPRIKEKNVKLYALKLLPCLQSIALRKETLLIETLSEFMKNFGKYLQICLNDNETFKLMEVFLSNIVSDCAVKRRCSAVNCMYLIENSRNKTLMSKYGLKKTLEFLMNDQETNTILGVLGFFRLLLPYMISEDISDYRQIIEIYDVCLHLLNNKNHSIINASLEVINSILNRPNRELEQLLTSFNLQHNDILKKKKSLKHQIFNEDKGSKVKGISSKSLKNENQKPKPMEIDTKVEGIELLDESEILQTLNEKHDDDNNHEKLNSKSIETNEEIRELKNYSSGANHNDDVSKNDGIISQEEKSAENIFVNDKILDEEDKDSNFPIDRNEDKAQFLSDMDNESFNSIDFESEIKISEREEKAIPIKDDSKSDMKSLKSADSIGSFFNSFLSPPNAETMTKLFRSSAKTTNSSDLLSSTTTNTPKRCFTKESSLNESSIQGFIPSPSLPSKILSKTPLESNNIMYRSLPTITNITEINTLTPQDDTISLESINSHMSRGSHISLHNSTQDLSKNDQDLVLLQCDLEFSQEQTKDEQINERNEILAEEKEEENEAKDIIKSSKDGLDGTTKNDTIDIGTIYDQTIIQYTVRFISNKFLLAGTPHKLIPDTEVRVSIKSLSLNVISNCVKMEPTILVMTMEIDKTKLPMHKGDGLELSLEGSNDNSSNEVDNDFQTTENMKKNKSDSLETKSQSESEGLLEIKDDHFGECTTTFFLNSPLSKSVDAALSLELQNTKSLKSKDESSKLESYNSKLNDQLEKILSKSEIIESTTFSNSKSDQIFSTSKPSKLFMGNQKNFLSFDTQENKTKLEDNKFINLSENQKRKQFIYDVLLFFNHSDPILRGNVQAIIGNFIYKSILSDHIECLLNEPWNLNKLLVILIKGLKDEIHTVIAQALTSLDKIYPVLLFNNQSILNKQMELSKIDSMNISDKIEDNDDDFEDLNIESETFVDEFSNTTKMENSNDKNESKNHKSISNNKITPKILLDKLFLCSDNKYWVVQNKFTEIISNLNYDILLEFFGSDMAYFYKDTSLKLLIQFLGDNDVRVREYTSERLCNFIQLNSCCCDSCNTIEEKLYSTNLNLLREFFDYRIFLGLSSSLRDLLNQERTYTMKKEKFLSKILYCITNNLMELDKKNLQFGIIFFVKTLLNHFNPMDYIEVWNEFNFIEICLTFASQNYAIGTDLQCQNDLQEIITKLLSANILTGEMNKKFNDMFIVHILKLLNIFYHLFSNQKPHLFIRSHKTDLFNISKEMTLSNSIGYFGNDYFYIKLYNTLKNAYDVYKMTINQESGSKLLILLSTCLHSLSACLDIREHSDVFPLIKLIEEILQYLTVLINHEPVGTIYCLRQLLKYLFSRNYANRKEDYKEFLKLYLLARKDLNIRRNNDENAEESRRIFQELIATTMNFPLGKRKSEEESAKYIKLFEPSVIYCLTLFMKSNATVQAPILELLSQLLEFNVTYSILDSKNVIFEQVMKNLELIETGVARNATIVIWAIVRFLVALTKQNDKKLITIPKIISVINSLLANNGIKICSVLSLKALTFEIFFTRKPIDLEYSTSGSSLNEKEICTQREVILGMLEKFITCLGCQKTLTTLMFWNRMWLEESSTVQDSTVLSFIIKAMEYEQIKIENYENYFVLNALFKNCDKNVLLESKGFLTVLSLFIRKNVDNFNDLSQSIVILDNILLRTEDIYLINHIKLFLETNQIDSCYGELNFFAKVLYEKLEICFSTFIKRSNDNDYCYLVIRYIRILSKICTKDILKNSFKLILEENWFCNKYQQITNTNMECLRMEILKLACELNFDKMLLLLLLKPIENSKKRKLFVRKICRKFSDPNMWTCIEVDILFSKETVEFLINDNCSFVVRLCQDTEVSKMILKKFSENIDAIKTISVPNLLKLMKEMKNVSTLSKVEFLLSLLDKFNKYKTVQKLIENSIQEEISKSSEEDHNDNRPTTAGYDLKSKHLKKFLGPKESDDDDCKIFEKSNIDEKWLIEQVTKLSSVPHHDEYVRILLDIKSEFKLKAIFNSINSNIDSILESCIRISFESMILSFRNDCIIYNPHINYMNMNALLKISLNTLMNRLRDITSLSALQTLQSTPDENEKSDKKMKSMASAIITLLENLEKLEMISLIYVEYKFIEKFVREQIFKQGELIQLLIDFGIKCAKKSRILINSKQFEDNFFEIYTYYECIDNIMKQKFIWSELNRTEKYSTQLYVILDMLYDGMIKSIKNTILYKRCKLQTKGIYNSNSKYMECDRNNEEKNVKSEEFDNVERIKKIIFIGKLIEMRSNVIDIQETKYEKLSMKVLNSIAISLLRMNLFYAYGTTPIEVFYNYENEKKFLNIMKLPTIPVEYLSDVDILQKFTKRLFIFGFSTRQQFEECFMTFLLLINKVYDENIVDVQEQFQIKNICLTAILELLIICKSFPIVGNRLSRFHHNTRHPRVKCNNISLKKLHKVQLLIPGSNIFYHPNLERKLSQNYEEQENREYMESSQNRLEDNEIGTSLFTSNQYGLNHIWELMERPLLDSETMKEGVSMRNFRYFIDNSGIDLKSSLQLIFDVLMQLIEDNYVLIFPNLVKFCEICENRNQIKCIKDKVIKLQETIPIDDVLSHQYIIYLLCKTQSILIPSSGDLTYLCSLISTYLKSTHVFIRNATLHGLLCLLECCYKTTTSIGKLSEELYMIRDLIMGYITRHGIITESSIQYSDMHTKLVWTLNFSLIEATSKFVPDCNLLSNSIISANNLLKRTNNEDIYLCVLHGLERIIVMGDKIKTKQSNHDKIEKLAIELVKVENEKYSIPALKLLLTCIYIGSSKQLESTEHSNGIVQDDPEIIVQQTEKVDILLSRIKLSTKNTAKIYGQVLCQIIRDLVPPNEILTKVIKEFLAINQPHCEVIARIVYQVFRSAIDSSFLQMLQEWLICSLPTFVTLPIEKGVWCLTVIFLSTSINLHLIKLFPIVLNEFKNLNENEIELFIISSQDFYEKLNMEQKERFKEIFSVSSLKIYQTMLKSL